MAKIITFADRSVVSDDSHPHLNGIRNVYVSGPMTGLPEFNYPAFRATTETLRDLGFDVYCPTERPSGTGEPLDTSGMLGTERLDADVFDARAAFADYSDYITRRADAVAVLGGWENSRGAKAEVALALAIGLPIIDAASLDLLAVDFEARAMRLPAETSPVLDGPELAAAIERHPAGKRGPTRTVAETLDAVAPSDAPPTGPIRAPAHGAVPDVDTSMVPNRLPQAPTPRAPVQPSGTGEVRMTSSTGGQKGTKEARYDLLPPGPLKELAVLYGRGNIKYPPTPGEMANWKRGYDWSLSIAALLRHLELFRMGEDYDEEMGVKHLACVAWHAFNLMWFMENRPEFDDRPIRDETYEGARPTPQWLLDLAAAPTQPSDR